MKLMLGCVCRFKVSVEGEKIDYKIVRTNKSMRELRGLV